MFPYILLFIFIVAGEIICHYKIMTKKTYFYIIFVLLICISGLRDISMGLADTEDGYIIGWKNACDNDWILIYKEFVGNSQSTLKDIGFAIITKLITYLSSNVHVYLFIINVPYMAASCWFIYKYSKYPAISFLLFISLNYFTCSYYLIRHICASTLIILAIDALLNYKRNKAIILILIATTFHMSAIFFLIAPFLLNKKMGKLQLFMIIITIIIGVIGRSIVLTILSIILKNSRFSFYITAGLTQGLGRWLMTICILILCISKYKEVIKDSRYIILYNLSVLTICFYALTPIIADFHRIAMFYGISNIILLPNVIRSEKNHKLRILLLDLVVVTFSAYMCTLLPKVNAYPYIVFWK